jgi:cytoskeleton protein RodZ
MVEPEASEIIGQRLRLRREARHITLEQAATALHIRFRYVEAMDKGDFDVFPSPAQARGFLRSYTQYLNLDAEPFMAALDGDTSLLEAKESNQPVSVDLATQLNKDGLVVEDLSASGSEQSLEREVPASDDQASTPAPTEGWGTSGNEAAGVASREEIHVNAGAVRSKPDSRYPRTKFVEIGQTLRLQRETLGLSLSDIERHTRLRAFYLKALEAGDLDSLPSPVQGRGMLKNYASFLGLDTDALLLQFAEGLQARLAARPGLRILKRSARATQYTPMGSPQPRLITTDLLLAGVLVLFLFAFMAWGVIRISTMRSGHSPTATAPAIADVLAQVGTPTSAVLAESSNLLTATAAPSPASTGELQAEPLTGGAQNPSATPPPGFSSASVQVIISVRMRSWMRVTVDGKVEFEGRVLPGSAFPFAGNDRIEILTGNGAGLDVNFNLTDIGSLGTFGEAVQRVFTVQGMQTPTPTITRTPAPATITPTITPTP